MPGPVSCTCSGLAIPAAETHDGSWGRGWHTHPRPVSLGRDLPELWAHPCSPGSRLLGCSQAGAVPLPSHMLCADWSRCRAGLPAAHPGAQPTLPWLGQWTAAPGTVFSSQVNIAEHLSAPRGSDGSAQVLASRT